MRTLWVALAVSLVDSQSCDGEYNTWIAELNACTYTQRNPKNWIDAHTECISTGGSLPVPSSSEQSEFLANYFTDEETFLGFSTYSTKFTNAATGQELPINMFVWVTDFIKNDNGDLIFAYVSNRDDTDGGWWWNTDMNIKKKFICVLYPTPPTEPPTEPPTTEPPMTTEPQTTSGATTYAPNPCEEPFFWYNRRHKFCMYRQFTAKTWIDANAECVSIGGSLPVPKTMNENKMVSKIGLTFLGISSHSQHYTEANTGQNLTFSNWYADPTVYFPNPNGDLRYTVVGTEGYWQNFDDLTFKSSFYCFRYMTEPETTTSSAVCDGVFNTWSPELGACFYTNTWELKTWEEADEECTMWGGSLPVPTNSEEFEFVRKFAELDGRTFLGISLTSNDITDTLVQQTVDQNLKNFYAWFEDANYAPEHIVFGYLHGNGQLARDMNDDFMTSFMCVEYQLDQTASTSTTSTTTSTTTSSTTTTTTTTSTTTQAVLSSCNDVFKSWSPELNACFYTQKQLKTWKEANEECTSRGGSLPVPTNYDQVSFVNDNSGDGSEFFLGVSSTPNDISKALMEQAQDSLKSFYHNLKPEQFMFTNGEGSIVTSSNSSLTAGFACVQYQLEITASTSTKISTTTQAVLQSCNDVFDSWSPELNACFYTQNQLKTWPEANEECTSRGGSLPVPTTDEQIQFVSGEAGGGYAYSFLGVSSTPTDISAALIEQSNEILKNSYSEFNPNNSPKKFALTNRKGQVWSFTSVKYNKAGFACVQYQLGTTATTSTTPTTSTTSTSSTTTTPATTPELEKEVKASVEGCNNAAGEMVLHLTVTGVDNPPESIWEKTGEFTYSAVYPADQADQEFDGDQLKLTVIIDGHSHCDEINIGGQILNTNCKDQRNFVFTCLYDLSDQVLEDGFTVEGADVTTATAQAAGRINYQLTVDKDVNMGQQITFEIVPKTPNVVFATVKSCTVKQAANQVDVFGYGDKHMCFLEQAGAGWENSPSSQETINGYWKAFQWYGDGLTATESQTLVCTIGLSKERNTQPVEKCDL